jgi:hypothetical protein
MIKIEHTEVFGWNATIRGMRNPMNSWDKSDSYWTHIENPETLNTAPFQFFLGENDLKLMTKLRKAGSDHRKFLRMINVTCDITAPLYWWKEYDTYKVGTVANSCSTMHKIHDKEFTEDDFSHEQLDKLSLSVLEKVIDILNFNRDMYVNYDSYKGGKPKKKSIWWQMIQLLPTSYNQKRTVQLNYEVLLNMYHARADHKLDEWHTLCDWIEELPYFRPICLED